MKTVIFRTFIFLLLFVSVVTCKHKCEKDPDSVWCPGCKQDQSLEGMKDYFFFKTGTWWVYREEISGSLDTVTVFYEYEGNTNGYDEFAWKSSSTYFEYNFNYEFNDSYTIHCLTDKDCDCRKLNRAKTRPGDYVGGGQYFVYPLFKNNYTYYYDAICTVTNIYSSYPVSNPQFSDVAEIDVSIDNSAINTGHHCVYWWAKDIGIVGFRNATLGTHWQLQSYQIIQ